MRKYIKNIITYLVVISLSVGTINLLSPVSTLASEIDGDIIENPWQDLFNPNHDNSDLPTSGVQNDDKNEKPTNPVDTTKEKEAIQKLKKQLKVKIISATKKSKKAKSAKIVIKKVKKAVSYKVKYSTSKKFKKSKTKTFKKRKMTLKKLKAGKRYYIKVRAVGKLNGKKVYGSWSKRKVIKIKKK